MQTQTNEPMLTQQEQALIPIAAFTASGNLTSLSSSLHIGLDAGLTISEVREVLVQMYAYTGFPRSLNALGALMAVVNERKQEGLVDVEGISADSLCEPQSSLDIGTENQTQLVGQPVTGALFDFAPAIDHYLKAHLFGDIFARDILSWKQRELATIAALANMQGVNSQLQAHYGISLNNGITVEQLHQFTDLIRQHCGDDIADNAQTVLSGVLGE